MRIGLNKKDLKDLAKIISISAVIAFGLAHLGTYLLITILI